MDVSTKVEEVLPWYRRLEKSKGLLLALVSMAQMLDIINVASVTITLPDILREVGYEVNQLQWVSSAYALSYGAFLLIGGRFGDLFGHRRIFIAGVTWFAIWSLINGFAKDPIVMSVGRALQGMGAGFTVPSALAILTTSYPLGPERTQALAIFGGTGAVGSVLGVLLGGIFGSTIGWRWIFYITSIIAFGMMFLAFFVIPRSMSQSTAIDRRVDYLGITAFMVGIVTLIYYLSESPAEGWASAKTLPPFIVGLVSLVLFIVTEYKIDYPIMPLRIWRSRRLVASCVTIICVSASMNGMIFFSSLVLQNVLGYTPMKTSLAYIVHGIGAIVSIILLTKLIVVVRTKILMMVGWLFLIASSVLWAQIKADSLYWEIPFPSLILNFLGMAPVWLCCQVNSVADAPDEDQGVVGAVYNVSLQLGAPIGIAITNIIANTRNDPLDAGEQLLDGYQAAFYAGVVISGVGLALTTILANNSDPPNMHTKATAEKTVGEEEEVIGSSEMDTISPSDKSITEKEEVASIQKEEIA
ncbi:hypothetical protein BGZ76_005809 [Entomortierella beljakovae]|nr:hypothetical protein BGZ76_005809 [Entomortierella beljakovae]